ncbi:MAG TPA: VOC family protein [Bradyrhizobium sp.]|nr:VOC family protein [Bradyrhizobium sp.]
MQINPYLTYNDNCEVAFKFYEKALGAKIEMMMRNEDGPEGMSSPERKKKIMHGRITIDGQVLMASDMPADRFQKPQGFSISLTVNDPAEAERKFKALAEGGSTNMPFGKTFFSRGFGSCFDQFGIPWMVICPLEG